MLTNSAFLLYHFDCKKLQYLPVASFGTSFVAGLAAIQLFGSKDNCIVLPNFSSNFRKHFLNVKDSQ